MKVLSVRARASGDNEIWRFREVEGSALVEAVTNHDGMFWLRQPFGNTYKRRLAGTRKPPAERAPTGGRV